MEEVYNCSYIKNLFDKVSAFIKCITPYKYSIDKIK